MLSSFWPPPGRTPAVTWYWLLHSQNKVIVNTRLRPGSMMSWVGTFGKISVKIGNNSPVILDRPLTNWQRLQWSLPTVAAAAWNQLSCLVMRRCVEICGHRSVLSVLRIKYRSCEPNIVLWRLTLTQKCDVIKKINFRCWLQIKQSDVSDSKSKLGYWLNYIQSQKRQVFDWRLKIAVAAVAYLQLSDIVFRTLASATFACALRSISKPSCHGNRSDSPHRNGVTLVPHA